MDITPKQEVEINDFKAHILKLRNELKIVNDDLGSMMRLKDTTSIEVDVLLRKKDELYNEIEELKISIKNREDSIKKSEDEYIEEISKLKKEIEELKDEYSHLEIQIIKQEETISSNNKKKELIEKDIEDKERIQKEKSSDLEKLLLNVIEVENKRDGIKNEIELLEKHKNESEIDHSRAIVLRKKELSDLDNELEQAKAIIAKPLEALKNEEERFLKEKRNFDIRRERLIKYVKKYFPNETLKI
ncbi:MAG TPA: hypothetical protein PKV66_01510 [Candidatus Pelethenecus sp.]|nr:hypothetical protein [Candidatus Pelethenecus sp.]